MLSSTSSMSSSLPLPKIKIPFSGKQVATFQVVTGNGLQGPLSSGMATADMLYSSREKLP